MEGIFPLPGVGRALHFSMTYSLAGFKEFCGELKTEKGEILRVEPFQERFLRDHFKGVVEEVVVIPKKNGKTTIFAALGLYHLENWPEADVILVARSREQATIMFRQATKMVKRSRLELRFDCRDGYKIIRLQGHKTGPLLRVLAADANTADGELPTLALVDELHRQKTAELYGVLRDGLDARGGRMVTMSTAGFDEDSPLGVLRKKAKDLPTLKRKGAYTYARSADGSFSLHEWSLEADENLDNLRLVKRANPASWHTIASLRRAKNSPSMTSGQWARFRCGVWTHGEEAWLEAKDWDALRVDIGQITEKEAVWAAVDVGTNPAVALAAPRAEEAVAVRVETFEGDVPLERIEARLVELSEVYELRDVSFDKTNFLRSAELLEQRGLTLTETPHSPERMSIVTQTLRRLIEAKKLLHDGNEALRAQVLAGTTKETERGLRLVKTYKTRGLIALAFAAHRATQVEQRSVYETRDLGVFG